MEGPVLPLVVGPLDQQGRVLLADGDLARDSDRANVPFGPFTVTSRSARVTSTPDGTGIGSSSDSGHGCYLYSSGSWGYQT